jgi:hypothetical protein
VTRPLARAALAVAITWGANGCLPCESVGDPVMRWSFETCPNGTCGFVVEAGYARQWATFHQGEHGADLGPNTRAHLVATRPWPGGAHDVAVDLLARCDEGTALTIDLQPAASASSMTEPSTRGTPVSASYEWAPHRVRFSGETSPVGYSLVRFVTTGRGNCQIDEVELVANARLGCAE